MKFMVTVVRYGGITVEANSREEALKEASENALLGDVVWDDDWSTTDAVDAEEEDDFDNDADYSQNMPCDTSGYCAGMGCPKYCIDC